MNRATQRGLSKVLFVASEVEPYSKTGGLADVAGALPRALARRGHQVVVVTPSYGSAALPPVRVLDHGATLEFPFGAVPVRFHLAQPQVRLTVVFLEAPQFLRPGLYGEAGVDYPDNAQRFAVLPVAALAFAKATGFLPEVVHLNDWQTGLGALALRTGLSPSLPNARVVTTIHNLAYQGNFPKSVVDALGLPWRHFTPEGFEFHDQVSFLKAGLVFSDALTTVSPTYAREIQTPEAGDGLDGVLRARANVLTGIVNGIDTEAWDPSRDAHLPAPFSADALEGKEANSFELLRRYRLTLPRAWERRGPIFGVIGRMAWQKGVELLHQGAAFLAERGASVVVLGTGEAWAQDAWRALAARYPTRVGVQVGFDEQLAHLIEAGSDFFLMPSRYEPCGLNQLYSLRYGAVPVVRDTGGLADTVTDLSQPGATGVKFGPFSWPAFEGALAQALALFSQREVLAAVRRRGMRQDFSWDTAAAAYERVYAGR